MRSYIQHQEVLRNRPDSRGVFGPSWYRAQPIKKMTVELVKPFVYPEEPKDLSAYVFFFSSQDVGKGDRLGYRLMG